MPSTITVEGKVLGRRRPLFTDWSVPLPPGVSDGGKPFTLRDLIVCVVHSEIAAFEGRQAERRLQKILSSDEIEQGLAKGKVSLDQQNFEQADLDQAVNAKAAVDVAILGFIDGLYYVFLDDVQQEDLDATVSLQAESRLTFLRLVALVGG